MIIIFKIYVKTTPGQSEELIISSLRANHIIQEINIRKIIFGDRFSAILSKEDQTITIDLSKIDFKDDGLEFRSELFYQKQHIFVQPQPSITTKVFVIGKMFFI